MEHDGDLEFKAIELSKFSRWLLYICLSLAIYSCIYIVSSCVMVEDADDLFGYGGIGGKLGLFFITCGIALFISWGAGIYEHKDNKGKPIKLTKERSKNFARYSYYTCIMTILIVIISLIDAIVI